MDMARFPSSVGSTYTRTLDFLDNQSSFDNIFGLASDMLLVTARCSRAIEEFDTLRSNISTMCSRFQLHLFKYSPRIIRWDRNLRLQPDDVWHLSWSFDFKTRTSIKEKYYSYPDDLYRRYIQYLPLLSSNAMTWSCSLVTPFPMSFLLN